MAEEQKEQSTKLILGLVSILGLLSLVGILAFGLGKRQQQAPVSTAAPEITPSLTPEASPFPEPTLVPTSPILIPTVSPTPTPTPTPSPTPTPAPQADLHISEYSFNHPPKKGEPFTVRIGIYNQGNAAASAFWWEWWPTKFNFACRQRIGGGIGARGGRIVSCTYTYGGWANYETKAVADADNEVSESNEGNNTHTQNVVPIH